MSIHLHPAKWEAELLQYAIPVIPPGAQLAQNTRVQVNSLGKVPGVSTPQGWQGYPWRSEKAPGGVQEWLQNGANIGVRTGRFVAVDIDIDDEKVSQDVLSLALETLGPAPIRYRENSARRLAVYITEAGFSKRRVFGVHAETDARLLVEVLARGQQFVAHGTHSSGAQLRWFPSNDNAITCITAEQLDTFLAKTADLMRRIGLAGVTTAQSAVTHDADGYAKTHLDKTEVVEMLACVPNDGGWDELQDMAYAVKGTLGEGGLDVFLAWAGRWSRGAFDPEACSGLFHACGPSERIRSGAGTLLREAEKHGYRKVDFDDGDTTIASESQGSTSQHVNTDDVDEVDLAQTRTLDDRSLARSLAQQRKAVGKPVRFVQGLGKWVVWQGCVWEAVSEDYVGQLTAAHCASVARAVKSNAKDQDEKAKKEAARQAFMLCSSGKIQSVLRVLKITKGVLKELKDFDEDPFQLNTPNGLINLRTGELITEGVRDCLSLTKVSLGNGRPERWLKFVNEVVSGDVELALYLQKYVGYCLTGDTSEQCFTYLFGPGSNGKSVFTRVISTLMGTYAKHTSMSTFIASSTERHPTSVAALASARLVLAEEADAGRKWNVGLVKSVTGGEALSARFLYEDEFTFNPSFKLLFSGNHRPEADVIDGGLVRRLRLIPCTYRPESVNKKLAEELLAEGPGILAWMLEGCILWQRDGLARAKTEVKESAVYVEDMDAYKQWFDECVVSEGGGFLASRDAFLSWNVFARDRGLDVGSVKRLVGYLTSQLGLKRKNRNGLERGVSGVRLREVADRHLHLVRTPDAETFEYF